MMYVFIYSQLGGGWIMLGTYLNRPYLTPLDFTSGQQAKWCLWHYLNTPMAPD